MKILINNEHNLEESEIDEVVKRVKVLLVNSNNELLLGYSHNTYQFIGGHVEDEELEEAIIREVKEETGIELDELTTYNHFAVFNGYYKDWPSIGKNRKTEIYYYEVKTDLLANLENTSYTEHEKSGNFKLKYISIDNVINELKDNAIKYGDDKGIAKEMIDIMNLYIDNKKVAK